MRLGKISLIGVGLLGGSLGLAIKQRRIAEQVHGYVRRAISIKECLDYRVADYVTLDLQEAASESDLIVLCTPIAQMQELVERMLPVLKKGVIVTDVGSVKGTVVRNLEPLIKKIGGHFIGSHPMAGAEKMGVSAARVDLFDRAICVITPAAQSDAKAVQTVESFWKDLGCRTLILTPDQHDELVSRSSHLPHIVASELANYVLSPMHPKEQSMLCANGFRDTTRIASGSPEMWRDIALANRKNLLQVLGVFIEDLREFQLSLENEDQKGISEFFEKAKQRRDAWCSQSNSPE
jgi:prephenate dehydrogenase